ncbi:exopolysaccharide biosynthesis protein [Lactobacillus sp. CBA3605]|uniref:DUF4422 domain-containing protein n=1 Tax=Lactobacillus sp. CBA3605 TaxID=2099788 RepID=UPI000CFD884C|nr:DUF4422 domain-containing protein [Lactobacillus sp. CBA3605]AVK62252.1 exopolysaccharide biosynthesis protein [Lactobacillus sp. CBA3605]
MTTKIFVAAHKSYQMPIDKTYQPIFVGADINGTLPMGYQADNIGDNISAKNPNYNELTALYWIWKNCHAEVKGLMQYRRYLALTPKDRLTGILTQTEIDHLLHDRTVIVPKKRHYYIESNYSHYIHAHQAAPLDEARVVIAKLCPAYLDSYDTVMHRTSAHMFNMMIMSAKDFDAYAKWLFSILFAVDAAIDISDYDAVEARAFGYLSELLLDVWLHKNQISCAEVPVMYMEKQQLVAKGFNLLKRKFLPNAKKRTHF